MGTDYTTPLPANGDYRTYCEDAVKGPGKFEGEPAYTFYFYENMMEGDGYENMVYGVSYVAFDSTDADTAIFPELKGHKRAFLHEDDNGFVTCTLIDAEVS